MFVLSYTDDVPHDDDDNGGNDDDVQLDFTMGAPPEVDHDSNTPFISAEVPIIDIDISDELIRSSQIIADRARYIPLRLSLKERKKLRLVEASLNVSDYTDKVDIYRYKNEVHVDPCHCRVVQVASCGPPSNDYDKRMLTQSPPSHSHQSKSKRIHHQLIEICSVLCGLVVASDYREGQRLIVEREFKDNEVWEQDEGSMVMSMVMVDAGHRHVVHELRICCCNNVESRTSTTCDY